MNFTKMVLNHMSVALKEKAKKESHEFFFDLSIIEFSNYPRLSSWKDIKSDEMDYQCDEKPNSFAPTLLSYKEPGLLFTNQLLKTFASYSDTGSYFIINIGHTYFVHSYINHKGGCRNGNF